jgi:hypothetical protein
MSTRFKNFGLGYIHRNTWNYSYQKSVLPSFFDVYFDTTFSFLRGKTTDYKTTCPLPRLWIGHTIKRSEMERR